MVVLVTGGTSEERRVSVASAQNLASTRSGMTIWFIAPDGAVLPCAPNDLVAHERPFEVDFHPSSTETFRDLASALDAAAPEATFVLALHGGDGENGVIQRAFEERGLAFTGSGSAASQLAFDKTRAKTVMRQAGVRTPASTIAQGNADSIAQSLRDTFRSSGRLVAKPVEGGSSLGLHHVRSEESVPAIAEAIALAGRPFLLESFVRGTELTVGVVEEPGGPAVALPPTEIRLVGDAAFDFGGKYLGHGAREITPAEVEPEISRAAQQIALLAHQRLGCEGYSRTDLIVGEDGVYFLELNTLPGLTRVSFIPQQLVASGRTMADFVTAQIALARARRDGRLRTSRGGTLGSS